MQTSYLYIFESGQIMHGSREPNEAELECCELGILMLFRIGAGSGGLAIESLRADEPSGQRSWEPVPPCDYRADRDELR